MIGIIVIIIDFRNSDYVNIMIKILLRLSFINIIAVIGIMITNIKDENYDRHMLVS